LLLRIKEKYKRRSHMVGRLAVCPFLPWLLSLLVVEHHDLSIQQHLAQYILSEKKKK
jgi:hypothetical protein